MAGEAAETPGSPSRSRLGRRSTVRLSVLCLPGAGGPVLGEAIRHLWAEGAPSTVRLVVPTAVVTPSPMLIGDPLSGAYWPCQTPVRDSRGIQRDAWRRLRALQWFLWEMGVEVAGEVPDGTPMTALVAEAADHHPDTVVLAASSARRWRGTIRDLRRQAKASSIELRLAVDRRI